MADYNSALSAADQTLAFTLTYLAAQPVMPDADREMMLGILLDVRHHATKDHPVIADLLDVADHLILVTAGHGQKSTGMSEASAMFHVRSAVAKFAKWRAGRSNEVFQKQRRSAA